MVIRNTTSVIRSLPYHLINQVLELYSLLFGPSLQHQRTETFLALYSQTPNLSFTTFAKGTISSLTSDFFKNKKHTNFIRCLDLSANQKLNEKKTERKKLYKPKLLHFYNIALKVAIARNASNKKPCS